MFWNQGEICSAGTRVFVERPLYDDAANAFVDPASSIVLGEGSDETTEMGPLVSKEQQERVERFIEIGWKEATLAMQGRDRPTRAWRTATSSRPRCSPTLATTRRSRVRRSSAR